MHSNRRISGDNVPGFTIIRPLGRGGAGTVHLAIDQVNDEHVALKIVPLPSAPNTDARRRFERELTALRLIHHPSVPNIVRGEMPVGSSFGFVATRFVDGRSLDETCGARSRMTCILDVLDALDAMHEAGLVHRDVKPSNVVCPHDARAPAVLVDLGISTRLDHAGTPWTRLTSRGQVVGSPHYIAPERIEGAAGDAQSDIYSVGVMLFEVVYGRRPFEARTPTLTMLKALTAKVPDLDRLGVEANDSARRLHAIVVRALDKDPARRFPHACALADALSSSVPCDEGGRRALEATFSSSRAAMPTTTSQRPG